MPTLTDMFCGAGGSSTGALAVPGVTVETAMNHWARAIESDRQRRAECRTIDDARRAAQKAQREQKANK